MGNESLNNSGRATGRGQKLHLALWRTEWHCKKKNSRRGLRGLTRCGGKQTGQPESQSACASPGETFCVGMLLTVRGRCIEQDQDGERSELGGCWKQHRDRGHSDAGNCSYVSKCTTSKSATWNTQTRQLDGMRRRDGRAQAERHSNAVQVRKKHHGRSWDGQQGQLKENTHPT